MIQFTEEYLIGVELIDKEHENLFQLLNKVAELVDNEFIPDKYDNIMEVMGELTEYTKVHFADEEQYMEQIGYAGLEAQKKAHAGFVAKLEELELEDFDDNQQQVLMDIMDFLCTWLVQHIMQMDKKIPVA